MWTPPTLCAWGKEYNHPAGLTTNRTYAGLVQPQAPRATRVNAYFRRTSGLHFYRSTSDATFVRAAPRLWPDHINNPAAQAARGETSDFEVTDQHWQICRRQRNNTGEVARVLPGSVLPANRLVLTWKDTQCMGPGKWRFARTPGSGKRRYVDHRHERHPVVPTCGAYACLGGGHFHGRVITLMLCRRGECLDCFPNRR